MFVRLLIGMPLVLTPVAGDGSPACDRAAKAFGTSAQAVEATVKRWTDCLAANRQCGLEYNEAEKAQNTLDRLWAEAKRQCPDLQRNPPS